MYGKKVKLRFLFVFLILISVILFTFLILQSLKENVVYFQTPTEIKDMSIIERKKIRVGGMVKEKSIFIKGENLNFIITDFKNEINVTYSGLVPNLFAEKKGVVAEGFLKDRNYFEAVKVLAKHDENYMPPEIKKALGGK
jgi:cytochrome c-type biogenesis protein CcmE